MAREVRVAILGDSKDFSRAVSNANRDAGKLEGAFSKIGGIAKKAAIGLGVVGVGAVAVGKSFVDAAYESQKVTAQTGAVLKSMGLEAQASAEDIAKLSTALSLKTGIDDELIQSGSNVLITFGELSKQIGKDSKIWERANAATLDMSVALGQDMNSAALMVGKALNDPVRGLTALRRSGIQFTKQQEDQIKAMVEAGDTAGAQAIMLGELEKQFGGSAEAQATAADKLKVAWGNVQEELGAKLIPVIEKVATWLADHLPGAMAAAQAFMDNRLVPAFRNAVAFVQQHWPAIQAVVKQVMEQVRVVISGVVSVVTTLWNNFGNNILELVQRVWPNIQQVISGAMEFIRGVIQVITSLIKGDWAGVWEGIKGIVSGAWNAIQGLIKTALELIRSAIGVGLEVVGSAFKSAWNGMVSWFRSIPGTLSGIARDAWNGLTDGLKAAVDWIIGQLDRMLGPLDEILGKLARIPNLSPTSTRWGGDFDKIMSQYRTSRAQGGVVPGALGQPMPILAHGGEMVVTRGQQMRGSSAGGGDQVFVVQIGDEVVARLVANAQATGNRRGVG